MNKKRKKKIRKGRVAAALCMLAAIPVVIYGMYAGASYLINKIFADNDETTDAVMKVEVTPQMLACDSLMAHKIDSLMNLPQNLDTANIAISVFDVTTQLPVYERNADKSLIPASCMKISTAIVALKTLGMDYQYHEQILARGEMHRDTLVGTLLFRADDDPSFLDFNYLITKMRKRGVRHVRGNIIVSLAREDTLRAHPAAKTWDIPYYKTPLLLKGKRFVERHFLASLHGHGVSFRRDNTVNSALAKGSLGGGKYHYLASESHSLREVITPMLIHSSNIKADAIFYHIDWKKGLAPNRRIDWNIKHYAEMFWEQTGLFKADSTVLAFRDGSGLSPENRLSTNVLVKMLRYAYDDKQLRDYFVDEALASPAAGPRCGSLTTRMARPEYKGRLYCKTGTMVTVGSSSLSGYLIGADGHWYIFSIINSNSPVAESRMFQDRLCKMMMK